jgi:hypothetical protein
MNGNEESYRTDNLGMAAANRRYPHGRKPRLVTTNKPLAACGEVLHDGDLAEAIVDRLPRRT